MKKVVGTEITPARSQRVIDLRQPAREREAHVFREALPAATISVPQAKVKQPKPKRRLWSRGRILVNLAKVVLVLLGAVGFLVLNISLAERLIGIYFVAAIVYAIDSQRTFLVALIFLIMVAVWSGFGNQVSAEDYAVYAFYFLVIGLVSAIREMAVTRVVDSHN